MMTTHIVIPMSGFGQRFVNAGYSVPKPLIVVDGKPIIAHVVDLFPGADRFTFICNEMHLATTDMRSILQQLVPDATIVSIAPHKKGPVYAVTEAFQYIDDDEAVIVNYCDFGTYWDFQDFLHHVEKQQVAASVVAYNGFHPHMLGSTNYAFMREQDGLMLEIKEKEPFTDNRMQEYASNGTYYFKTGAIVKQYFKQLMREDIHLNHEYYVSLVYNLLAKDQLPISIYPIEHMLQWGTPEDVEEYQAWSDLFTCLADYQLPTLELKAGTALIMPMAGFGSRFRQQGYTTPKPLLSVTGLPMVIQAARSIAACPQQRFVCLQEHLADTDIANVLQMHYPTADIIALPAVTEGQAITVQEGLEGLTDNTPIFIGACDNGMLFNTDELQALVADDSVDAVVFSFVGYHNAVRNPHMYGWLKTEGNQVVDVAVKQPVSEQPQQDHAIVGSFYFKSAEIYQRGLSYLLEHNIRVNQEYYVDSVIGALVKLGLVVKVLPIQHYIGWGTPDDYRTFRYWQSYFHKAQHHPYSLDNDPLLNSDAIDELKADVMGRLMQQQYL